MKLHAYQDRAVTRFYEYPESIAVMPMGSGKTVVALSALNELFRDGALRRALIVAPLRVATIVWPDELNKWRAVLPYIFMQVIKGNAQQRLNAMTDQFPNVHVINYENLPWFMEKKPKWFHPDVVIFDEITRLKNPKSKRAKAIYKWLEGIPAVWGLTGTIATHGHKDLFMPAKLVTRSKLWGKSFYAWQQQHFEKHAFKEYEWNLKDGHDKIIEDEFATIAFTVDENDMPELPEMIIDPIWIELPPLAVAKYRDMQRDYMLEDKRTIVAANAGAMTMKLRQIAQGFIYSQDDLKKTVAYMIHDAKLEALKELVANMNGKPLLVAYDFQEDLQRITQTFKCPYIGAGIDEKQSKLLVDRWNGGKLPVLAVHPASAGHGLNMQAGGNHVCWYGLIWSLEYFQQLVARLRRQGQKANKVWNHIIMARNVTIDQDQLAVVLGYKTVQEAATDALTKI